MENSLNVVLDSWKLKNREKLKKARKVAFFVYCGWFGGRET